MKSVQIPHKQIDENKEYKRPTIALEGGNLNIINCNGCIYGLHCNKQHELKAIISQIEGLHYEFLQHEQTAIHKFALFLKSLGSDIE